MPEGPEVETVRRSLEPLLVGRRLGTPWVSGKALREKSLSKRREGYAEYVASTNGFFPGPPRRS